MKFHQTTLKDAMLIDLERRGDDRGFFARTFCVDEFAALGLPTEFVQQNTSYSANRGTLRGMHFQCAPYGEDKLIRCLRGRVFDVAVDLRADSPSFGRWHAVELGEDLERSVFIPEGCAHGFQALTDDAQLLYQHTAPHAPGLEAGVRHDDARLAIAWPLPPAHLSPRDAALPALDEALRHGPIA
jgi:dTDP-4-dehydrorhamnose 3,5-epimerase